MKKENIVELNIGVYESIKLKVNRIIAMDIVKKFPQLSQIGDNENESDESLLDKIDFISLYNMSIYGLYKMANALDNTFTLEKAEEIFDYASNVQTIIDGKKQACDMVLVGKIMNELLSVFMKEKGKEVPIVDFKME